LPPYDPLAEVAHRELLLPDPAVRRQVWRAVANPGLALMAGELAGSGVTESRSSPRALHAAVAQGAASDPGVGDQEIPQR